MSIYAADVTTAGVELFAKILANKATLAISRVMVGTGTMTDGMSIANMTDLIKPVAAATSDEPVYKDSTVNLTVQYRSDLNGGVGSDFDLREFGVYVRDPTDGNREVLVFYGNLGEHPQFVPKYVEGEAVDIYNFPISIAVGKGQIITVEYYTSMFVTSADVKNIVQNVLLPSFLETDVAGAIAAHNTDADAHTDIRNAVSDLQSRMSNIEITMNTDITETTFIASFENLEKVTATGAWNEAQRRIEF